MHVKPASRRLSLLVGHVAREAAKPQLHRRLALRRLTVLPGREASQLHLHMRVASRGLSSWPTSEPPGVAVANLAASPLEIARLPLVKFEGRIFIVSSLEDEQRVERLFAGETLLGFDSESRPGSALIGKGRTALIQIASEHAACIWRLGELGCIPPVLRSLIEDPARHMSAQGATQEVETLCEEWGVNPSSFIDLHHIALHLRTTPRSLQGLVALFMRKRLSKEQRLSNWEQSPLTQAQIEYAAIDAWSSRQVLVAIRKTYGVERLSCERLIGATAAGAARAAAGISTFAGGMRASLAAQRRAATQDVASETSGASPPVVAQHGNRAAEAHQSLAALCVERGYVLRVDGLEAVAGGYRCVLRVGYRRGGRSVEDTFRSKRPHESIRSAQNDAAAEALLRLNPPPSAPDEGSGEAQ